MIYEFREVGGIAIIEKYFRMADAPDLGSIIEEGGKKYMRIMSSNLAVTPDAYQGEREDVSLPRGQDVGAGLGPNGFPIVKNRQHDRELCARWGFRRD